MGSTKAIGPRVLLLSCFFLDSRTICTSALLLKATEGIACGRPAVMQGMDQENKPGAGAHGAHSALSGCRVQATTAHRLCKAVGSVVGLLGVCVMEESQCFGLRLKIEKSHYKSGESTFSHDPP